MSGDTAQQRETLLIEILQTSLDLRSKASAAQAPMLVYLADLLAKRTREELDAIASPRAGAAGPPVD